MAFLLRGVAAVVVDCKVNDHSLQRNSQQKLGSFTKSLHIERCAGLRHESIDNRHPQSAVLELDPVRQAFTAVGHRDRYDSVPSGRDTYFDCSGRVLWIGMLRGIRN